MSNAVPPAPGLFHSLRNLLETGLEIVHTRIELFTVEAQQEWQRLVSLAVMAVVGLILGIAGTVVLTATIVFALPASWRVYVTAALGLAYLGGAAIVFLRLNRRLKQAPPPFAESRGQIKKDCEWLGTLH
jgi:uncharacterized membrane protein YqjE